jgi:hypothetical protein
MPLHARPVIGSTTECRTYRPGRVCLESGCRTVLSIYNPASRCSLHERQQVMAHVRSRHLPWDASSAR